MNFENGVPIYHRNNDSCSSVVQGMPIPLENGIGYGEGVNPALGPRRPIMIDNRIESGQESCSNGVFGNMNSWNGIVQNANDWTQQRQRPILTGAIQDQHPTDSFSVRPHLTEKYGNGTGQIMNSGTSGTSEKQRLQETRVETENWQDLIGMYTGLLQEKTVDTNKILDKINPTHSPPMVCNNVNQNWVANPSQYRNHGSNQASTSLAYFNTVDPANVVQNGVDFSNRLLSSDPQSRVTNQGMNSSYWSSMLRIQQARRFASNDLIGNGHGPRDGFPTTYQPCNNGSSPPRSKPDAQAYSMVDSFPFAPITPDNQRKQINSQWTPEKVNFPVAETPTPTKIMHEKFENQTVSTKDADNLYNELLQTIADSPTSAISTTQKEHIVSEDRDEQETDLTKTPLQKTPTKRKKHRPKVIRERKHKQTPMANDPGNGSPNETRVKRKYVRKKGVNGKTPVEKVEKRKYVRKKGVDHLKSQQQNKIEDNVASVTETTPKSCKRQLNFDLEHVAQNESRNIKGSQQVINVNASPQNLQYRRTNESVTILDEKRGIKRHNFNVNTMELYQKLLLSSILLENHKKMKMQSDANSREMNGVYGNVSAMQLLNSCTGRVNPSYMAASCYLQKKQVYTMRSIQETSPKYSQGAIVKWNPSTPNPPNGFFRYAVTTYPNSYNQRLNGLNEVLRQHHNIPLKGYHQSAPIPRGRPRKQKAEVSVDDITHKLEGLRIYDGNKKKKNELVLYRGNDAMIPFEPNKKRIPRPKVDIDPETERLWRLLMGIEGNECPKTETVDTDKEKWWEDERRVFRGRADSFIARMHLVQGDRRFSRWKGSVVDSVIGVFLTQNVSDHLSSSAFMSLAAKFPHKSTAVNETGCQDGPRVGPTEIAEKILEEEVILSQDSIDSSTIQTVDEYRSSSGSNSEAEDLTPGFETSKQYGPPVLQRVGSPSFEVLGENTSSLPSSNSDLTEANSQKKNTSYEPPPSGPGPNMPKPKKGTVEDESRRVYDWDSLRKEALYNDEKRERNKDATDSLDYEALRRAHVNEISDAIRERGMNNLLADRIKDFLNRLVRDHGTIDLEWLRDAPPDKAKDYLLSFRGLGLKSVECVRLLTLHHLAFPVDTNVGRIAVRLGWVPLQPLPESLQLHLLEMYPVLESIQKYLWPRLCKLDQLTLYELHYQMITFGKVFCTKSKPNCNACPMRPECRHFASAFASARLSLPGPEEKRIVTSNAPVTTDPVPPEVNRPMPLPLPPTEDEFNKSGRNCEPIIEEPTTPEPEAAELSISDIEDQYYEDSDEIPSIKLNMEEFATNLQSIMQDNKELQDNMSKALVALNPKTTFIPTPKLKDVSRLRTEHLVYELPDSHQLLKGLDKREPDDPSHYLLAIWTPGETATSIQPPEIECLAQQSGQLCDRSTCFSCNSVKEANSQVVRGTILIPCRTAMRGSFPLNGTYFQVNEMFADHASSLNPIDVPRSWIWNLPRRTVYFGTSVSTIFKGLSTEGIQYCFWKGFVCVRGFDRINRSPKPLMARLHFPASRLIAQKRQENK